MTLFNHLPDRIFVPLGGPSRVLYEQVLLLVYAKYYSSNAVPPTKDDIVSSVVDLVYAKPELRSKDDALEHDGGGDSRASLTAYARRAVSHLEDCGWFEANRSGYRVLMEFSPAALPLIQSLLKINDGSVLRLEGVMLTLRDIMEKLASGHEGYASSIDQCAIHLREVLLTMRGTRTKLLNIRSNMFKLRGADERFRYLVDKYAVEILPHDISRLLSDSHPYRFKRQILKVLDTFKSQKSKMLQLGQDLARELFPHRLDSDSLDERMAAVDEGMDRVYQAFAKITSSLEDIADVAHSILDINTKVHRQLVIQGMMRNTHSRGDPQRLERLLLSMGHRLACDEDAQSSIGVPMTVIDRVSHLSESALRLPNVRRRPVSGAVEKQTDDPLSVFRNGLTDTYLARIEPSEEKLLDFLDRALAGRECCLCDDLSLRDIDDFIMATALVRMIVADEVPPIIERAYALVCEDEGNLVDTRFAQFPEFEIVRIMEIRNVA